MISLMTSLFLAAAVADTAASTAPSPAFSMLDASACEGDGDTRRLSRQKAISQLLTRYPIMMDAADFSGPQTPLAQRVALACADDACLTPDSSGNPTLTAGAYAALNRTVGAMLDTREDDRFRLTWNGAGAEPAARTERIAAFFDLSQETYALQCTAAQPLPPVIAEAPPPPAEEP